MALNFTNNSNLFRGKDEKISSFVLQGHLLYDTDAQLEKQMQVVAISCDLVAVD